MKHFTLTLAAILWSLSGFAQIGNGVIMMVDDNYQFAGTTVDSIASFEISVHNVVGAAQTVYFSALDAPFSLEDNTPIEIPANDSATVVLQFAPQSLGSFSGSLEAIGSVFGSATLNFSGTGIQVVLDWTPEALVFETTAIGQTATQDVTFTNTGNGLAVVEGIDDPNGLFSVEFVDTYVAPTSPICLEYNESVYHNFYLTVDLGTNPGETYWQIQDNNGYYYFGGDYNNAVDSMELCLPVEGSPNSQTVYMHLVDYSNSPDGSMELKDVFGNIVWSYELSIGSAEYSNHDLITVGNPPAAPSFTPGVIEEGDSQTARVTFSPTDAGIVNGSIQFNTNSALSAAIEIACEGTGISEVSGEMCDIAWTESNSPYNLVGDIEIPLGCTLTIEPGVQVFQNGASILVKGELIANGTANNPISITGGGINWYDGEASQMMHVNRIAEESQFEEIYYNRFESTSDVYEFDCFDSNTNNYITGTNTSYDTYSGCNYFGLNSGNCSSQFTSDNNYLDYRTRSFDGYLYLADTVFAPQSGTYEISLNVQCMDVSPRTKFQLQLETAAGWEIVDEIKALQNGMFLLRSHEYFLESAPINFRLYLDNEYGEPNEQSVRIDDVRIGRLRYAQSLAKWDVTTYADSVNAMTGSYFTDDIFVNEDTLIFSTEDNYIVWQSSDFETPPIVVPHNGSPNDESSSYYLRFSHNVVKLEYNCHIRFYVLINGDISDQSWSQNAWGTNGFESYNWHTSIVKLPSSVSAGDRLDFRVDLSPSSTNSNYDEVDFKIHDVEIFQLGFSDASSRDLTFGNVVSEGVNISGASLSSSQSSLDQVTLSNGDIAADSSLFNSILISEGDISLSECEVSNSENPRRGVEVFGDSANINIFGSDIHHNWGGGLYVNDSHSNSVISHSFIRDNSGDGMYFGQNFHTIQLKNSLIDGNSSYAYANYGHSDSEIDYCTITNNGSGIYHNDGFHTFNNSIIWFNGTEQQINYGLTASSYSNIQGINSILTDPSFAWGDGGIGSDPLLSDDMGNLDSNSPCVDGGMPWEEDAHIPVGQGSSRADMGLYGGPDNAYWGGSPPPDGSVIVTEIFDIPADQGYQLGILFDASPFDFGGLGFNIDYYSIWRDLSVGSNGPVDIGSANWEQIGTVPAQGFNSYGYTAETLVNSQPENADCWTNFIVVAHTEEENIYWVSDVAGACALDNLAPADPDANGLVLDSDGETVAQIHWSAPEAADYAYTEVTSDAGYTAQLNNDTLIIDNTIVVGNSYTYTIVHADINGNESNPVQVTLDIPAGLDIIPLTAGWNLISTDRTPTDASIEAVFATLEPGNLDYITGFDGGVQFYDPEGLSFLNSLSALSNGQGYWVRVAEDDTLEVSGTALQANYLPALNAGWNIIGFPNAADAAPADYFADFITDGSLEYVTGFDGGSTYFDPNGLSFLNSLTALENGFGYWVKVTEPFDPNGMVLTGDEPMAALTGASHQHANPNFMLVNGTSDLTHAAGTQVEVRRADGSLVAQLPVLEGGYLMTTALFGDDPSTDAIEGLQVGEELHFEVQGQRAEQSLVYSGQMDIKHLALTFGAAQAMASVFPNPFVESLQVSAVVETPGYLMCELTDAVGKVVAQQPMGWQAKGAFKGTWEVLGLAPGMYTCKILKDDEVLLTMPVLKR